MKETQEQRILQLLKNRGDDGVKVYEFMIPRNQGGCGIAQYNARIWGLRKKGYKIINKTPGHFVLQSEDPEQLTMKNLYKDNALTY